MNLTGKLEYCRRGMRAAVAQARTANRNAITCAQHGYDAARDLAKFRRDLWMDDARRYQRWIAAGAN